MDIRIFKLSELGMVKGLPLEVVNKVLELAKNPILGRYDFAEKIYINVETYVPVPFDEKEYEAHREYVDVQCILAVKGGSKAENIYVAETSNPGFKVTKPYVHDIEFMDGQVPLEPIPLNEGEFCILTPDMAHKPCIRRDDSDEPVVVVKAVIKLPLELYGGLE